MYEHFISGSHRRYNWSINWFFVSKLKNQEKQVSLEKLQWELENEKANAEQNAVTYQKQIETVKAEAKEQIESIKADYDKRIAEIRADEEKQTKEMLSAQEKHFQQVIQTQQDLVKETVEKFDAKIKISTDEMLKQRQKEFTESSTTNIEKLLNPLRENMEKMNQTMNENTLKHTAINSEMKVKLEDMMKHSESAKQSAEELARVLKHKSKVQGDWGERILNEILESQGLTEGIHYETQSTIRDAAGNVVKTDTGGNLRPDVIMHIDYNRDIIIDSKVSLTAFMDFVNAETEEERQIHLKAHIDSIQKHVKELSKKDYSSYIQPPKVKMDYVIMFVPHSGALWTALNSQSDLWRKAMEMNVFIADEQTLFAALRIINLTWTHIAQAENHEKVYALANEMIDRVGKFIKSYETIGKALETAHKAYKEGENKLTPGGQSIIQTCVKLEKLGAKQNNKKQIGQFDSSLNFE